METLALCELMISNHNIVNFIAMMFVKIDGMQMQTRIRKSDITICNLQQCRQPVPILVTIKGVTSSEGFFSVTNFIV